jgi:hypothetical protein
MSAVTGIFLLSEFSGGIIGRFAGNGYGNLHIDESVLKQRLPAPGTECNWGMPGRAAAFRFLTA